MRQHLNQTSLIIVIVLIMCCACSKKEEVADAQGNRIASYQLGRKARITLSELEGFGLAAPSSITAIAEKLNLQQRELIVGIDIKKGENITDLLGLRLFPNLRNLYIEGSSVPDLRKADKNKLEVLSLVNGHLDSLDGIEAFEALVGLNINGNPIRTLNGIYNLKHLRYMDLSKTNITFVGASDLPASLETIYYRDSSLRSIRGFQESFITVTEFDATHNDIDSIDDVTDWGNLKYLHLFVNPIMERFRDADGEMPKNVNYKGVTLVFEPAEN